MSTSVLALLYSGVGLAKQTPAHAQAVSAVADIQTAVDVIVKAEDSNAAGPDFFRHSAQRAVNALVGAQGDAYRAAAGNPASPDGALGHINRLLDRSGTFAWEAPAHGAWVNTMVAVSSLRSALDADDLDSFQTDMSSALGSLQVALGRASEVGTLGGLKGALANTELGVPVGGKRVSGCQPPLDGPAYGVTNGYLAFFATSADAHGQVVLPQVFGVSRLTMEDGLLVVYTAAAKKVAAFCEKGADSSAQAGHSVPTSVRAKDGSSSAPTEGGTTSSKTDAGSASAAKPAAQDDTAQRPTAQSQSGSSLPALYTESQAKAGKPLYAKNCASCHGADTQGGSAPANAGTAFLKNAHALGWSVSDVRYLVVNSMPLNDPGSLSPKEYAQVMAFLLASSCYPAGDTIFPVDDAPRLKNAKLAPLDNVQVNKPKSGLCAVP